MNNSGIGDVGQFEIIRDQIEYLNTCMEFLDGSNLIYILGT